MGNYLEKDIMQSHSQFLRNKRNGHTYILNNKLEEGPKGLQLAPIVEFLILSVVLFLAHS